MPYPMNDTFGAHSPYAYLHLVHAVAQMDATFHGYLEDKFSERDAVEEFRVIREELAHNLGIPLDRLLSMMEHTLDGSVAGESGGTGEGGKHHQR